MASRAHSRFGLSAIFNEDLTGAAEAIQLAVEAAGDLSDARSGPTPWAAQALLHNVNGHFAAGLDAAERADPTRPGPRTRSIPCILALMFRSDALPTLGACERVLRRAGETIDVARRCRDGRVDAGLRRSPGGAAAGGGAGRPRASSVATAGYREGVAAGLTRASQRACGEAW